MDMERLISTREAAVELGIGTRRVQRLIEVGRLPAIRVGANWVIRWRDLDRVRVRVPGNPNWIKGKKQKRKRRKR